MTYIKKLMYFIGGGVLFFLVGCGVNSSADSVVSANTMNQDTLDVTDINNSEISISSNLVIEQDIDDNKLDIDLTGMNLNMVYASLYQMLESPEEYNGKVIKMQGTYYPGVYEETNMVYHYCMVEDEMACCIQGMEFVWGDGSHKYPEEYPEEYEIITVTGTFETYTEPNTDYVYSRLANATLETQVK